MEENITIPFSVLASKTLNPRDKILYGVILSLSKKEGFCWATNGFFAEKLDVSYKSTERSIKSLLGEGLITCEYINDGKNKTQRKIYVKTKDKATKYSYSQKISSLKNEIEKKSRPKKGLKTGGRSTPVARYRSTPVTRGEVATGGEQVIYNNTHSGSVSDVITKNLPSGGLQIFSKSADTTKSSNVNIDQSEEKDHRKAVKVISIFSAITPTYDAMFAIPAQRKAAIALYDALGSDGVMSLVSDFVKYRDRQYAPMVGSVTDFLRLLGKIQQFVEKEKRAERKDYTPRGTYKVQTPTIKSKSTNPFYKRAEGSI